MACNAEFVFSFVLYLEQAGEQTVEFLVLYDVMTLMWRHSVSAVITLITHLLFLRMNHLNEIKIITFYREFITYL